MSGDSLDHRIIELEIRYTHQEALVQTLSDLVREQHDTIERLTKRVAHLEQRLDEGGPAAPGR